MTKKSLIIAVIFFLASIGYVSAADQDVIMEIKGMTCPLCTIAVKKSLSEVDRVKDVEVSLKEEKAWLTAEESVTDKTLIEAVEKAGSYKGGIIQRMMKKDQ